MNGSTRTVIKKEIDKHCETLQELIADYYQGWGAGEVELSMALLSLAVDSVRGVEDSTCTLTEMFAQDYSNKDLDMMDSKETILFNRKAIKAYVENQVDIDWGM